MEYFSFKYLDDVPFFSTSAIYVDKRSYGF